MEVIYIQHMKVLLYNQVYNTKTFIFPAGGEWMLRVRKTGEAVGEALGEAHSWIQQRIQALSGYCGLVKIDWFIK